MRIRLRDATEADVPDIAALHLASWRSAYRGIVPDSFLDGITLEDRCMRWIRAVSGPEAVATETVVALDGTDIVGVCSFGPSREPPLPAAEIYALHVQPERRRQGIGTLLLDAALRRLLERGFRSAVLWVLTENNDARRFYEACGWALTGEDRVEGRHGHAIPEVRLALGWSTIT